MDLLLAIRSFPNFLKINKRGESAPGGSGTSDIHHDFDALIAPSSMEGLCISACGFSSVWLKPIRVR